MRVLYCATDQIVPGTKGGSTHVLAVAEGLAKRGHEVHVLATPGVGGFPRDGVRWHAMAPLGRRPQLRWLLGPAVARIANELMPDVIIERYHNFGGEGVLSTTTASALRVLEVNAPIIDYPGSPKAWLDRLLVMRPLERWRDRQVRRADLVVAPSAAILPAWTPRDRVLEIEWGADTERFHPGANSPSPFAKPPGAVVAVFAGAFRTWHGAIHLARAVRRLRAAGHGWLHAVFVGDGPERAAAEEAAGRDGITFVGAVAHDDMPAYLAHADIGVAPFDVGAHAPLQIAFYWSPLKIFEYMASGLPVVAPALPRLQSLVGDAGVLYDGRNATSLDAALLALGDEQTRRDLGQRGRRRAVERYSWDAHCEALEHAMQCRQRAGVR
jgi:glycosyltransferase involved in cell wall biosynthesis